MTRIAVIRHYPTAWNAEARLQGQTDIPLTASSRATLETLRMPLPWREARLFASPLQRAQETAHILANGRQVILDDRLIEISWGDWEGALAQDLLADPASGFRPTHEWDLETSAPSGESMKDAWKRVVWSSIGDFAAKLSILTTTISGQVRRRGFRLGTSITPFLHKVC